jgi:hypothetical protein
MQKQLMELQKNKAPEVKPEPPKPKVKIIQFMPYTE